MIPAGSLAFCSGIRDIRVIRGQISTLTQLLETPYKGGLTPITPALLRLDPCLDDLRGDPRFDKIVAAAKAASR
jgi:hypothetical protein